MKSRQESIKTSIVILFLTGVLYFLMVNIGNTPLWQDEAESALNAMTITTSNIIPRAYEKEDLPMHECRVHVPKKDDPMYDWYSTAYYYSPYVTTHGWLPYYFIKLGIFLLGKNELGPRFFSAIFFIMFLFTLYKILNRYSGYLAAILTLISMLFMPNMLTIALQARHYTYILFFSMLTLLCFLRYFEKQSILRFSLFVIAELVLYYTNLQCFILMSGAYFICTVLKNRKLSVKYIYAMTLCFIGALPHLIITKLHLFIYRFSLMIPKEKEPWVSGWKCLRSALNYNDYLIAISFLFMIIVIGRAIFSDLKSNRFAETSVLNIVTLCLVVYGYPFICLTTPENAIFERIFLPLTPFIVYAAIEVIIFHARLLNNRALTAIGGTALCALFILYPVISAYSQDFKKFFSGRFTYVNITRNDSWWVLHVIKYIKSTGARNPLILTSFEQCVFTYYSNYDAQLLWPVKKEFIDSTTRNLFIALEPAGYLDSHAVIYYPEDKKEYYSEEKNRNYYDRISRCDKTEIGSVTVYSCLEKGGPKINEPALFIDVTDSVMDKP